MSIKLKILEFENTNVKQENIELKNKITSLNENSTGRLMEKIKELEFQIKLVHEENANLKIFLKNNEITIQHFKKISNINENNNLIDKKNDENCKSSSFEQKNSDQCNICNNNVNNLEDISKCRLCFNLSVICKSCTLKCSFCKESFCMNHLNTCGICDILACRGDTNICEGCNRNVCRKCFDIDVFCSNCEWIFEKNSKDKLIIIEENGYLCKTYNTSNCMASAVLGNKKFSVGVHKWRLKIKSPICKMTDFGILIFQNLHEVNSFENCNSNIANAVNKSNKISIKQLGTVSFNKNISEIYFCLHLINNEKKFQIDIGDHKLKFDLSGHYFLPYFILCNNSILLTHHFVISNK
jgi:hypothetical protein